ncbi:MAG: molybdopterin cofactor-binding domain-containing protein [Thermoanaerobaculia bacterium]
MSDAGGMDRRTFFRLVGGGVVVCIALGPTDLFSQDRRRIYPEDLNAYLRIGEDGRVTIFTGKIEMGQGVMTSQAQMAAEELGVALASIDMVMGDTDTCPWDMGTFGSLTTRMFGPALRAGAAEGREAMLELGAKKLGVPKANVTAKDGVVSVVGSPSRKVTYGELAKGKKIARLVDEKAVLRKVSEFQIMGQSPTRLDAREKVTGAAKYAGDIRVPGMLYARILRPPAHGATLKSADTTAAGKIAGVTLVNQDGLIAVLAADPEAADAALGKIDAKWDVPKSDLDGETIFEHLVKAAPAPEVKEKRGDPVAARTAGGKLFESTFRTAYHAHAPMEPHTAIAEMKDGKMTVWAGTQTPFPTRDRIAKELGLAKEKVRVITPYVGGGFGGKSASGQAIEAAKLAKISGKPVQVRWSREEEFFYDTFDPASVIRIVSAVDPAGKITLWDYGVYAAGSRGTDLFYDVPNASIRAYGGWMGNESLHPFAVGAWRAPGANANVFAAESQIDMMAAAAGIDPLEFRLRNTTDPRMRKVLQTAADAFGWKPGAGPTGKGRGLACGIDAGSYVALMADVDVDPSKGTIRVKRILAAQDMGIVVNPVGAKMQMEGCMTMGLGYPLTEELRFHGGEILDQNFGTYELPRFSTLPKIETVLVKNDDVAPQGGGEPAIVPMGAVIANGVFDATGARLYRLPMTPERVLAALKELQARRVAGG